MSAPASGVVSGPTIYGNVDFGPSLGNIYRPLNNKRIVTAAGNVTVQPFDQLIILKKTVAAITTVLLPSVLTWLRQPYGGFPLIIKDGSNNASSFNITITPDGTDKIDTLASFLVAGDGAIIYLDPLPDYTGWVTL